MKRNIFLLFFIGLLLNSHPVICMKRKRTNSDQGPAKKRRKKNRPSVYDQYKNGNGYDCPDCDYSKERLGTFRKHLSDNKHGHYKNRTRKKRASIYDQYKRNDGKYYCPEDDCNYSGLTPRNIQTHLYNDRHGPYKDKVVKSKCNIYKWKNGWYYCPDCAFSTKTLTSIWGHLSYNKHGFLKPVPPSISYNQLVEQLIENLDDTVVPLGFAPPIIALDEQFEKTNSRFN